MRDLRPAGRRAPRLRAVEIGISTTSSWSWPTMLWPLRSSTPTTSCGTWRMRTVSPTGIGLAEQAARHGLAEQHDLGGRVDVLRLEQPRPSATAQLRATRYSGVTPRIDAFQLLLPNTIWPEPRSCGAEASTSGISRCSA